MPSRQFEGLAPVRTPDEGPLVVGDGPPLGGGANRWDWTDGDELGLDAEGNCTWCGEPAVQCTCASL